MGRITAIFYADSFKMLFEILIPGYEELYKEERKKKRTKANNANEFAVETLVDYSNAFEKTVLKRQKYFGISKDQFLFYTQKQEQSPRFSSKVLVTMLNYVILNKSKGKLRGTLQNRISNKDNRIKDDLSFQGFLGLIKIDLLSALKSTSSLREEYNRYLNEISTTLDNSELKALIYLNKEYEWGFENSNTENLISLETPSINTQNTAKLIQKIIDENKTIWFNKHIQFPTKRRVKQSILARDQYTIDLLDGKGFNINGIDEIKLIERGVSFFLEASAGSGKSTLFKWLSHHYASNYKKYERIPLLIELKKVNENSVLLIQKKLEERSREQKYLLLVDGLDEFSGSKQLITSIIEFSQQFNVTVIVSGRNYPAFLKNLLPVFSLGEFSSSEIKQLINLTLDESDSFSNEIIELENYEYIRNPLLLSLVITIVKQKNFNNDQKVLQDIDQLLANKGTLFYKVLIESFLSDYELKTELNSISVNRWKAIKTSQIQLMSYLAHHMTRQMNDTEYISENFAIKCLKVFSEIDNIQNVNVNDVLPAFEMHSIIEYSESNISFKKKEYRLFFCALYLNRFITKSDHTVSLHRDFSLLINSQAAISIFHYFFGLIPEPNNYINREYFESSYSLNSTESIEELYTNILIPTMLTISGNTTSIASNIENLFPLIKNALSQISTRLKEETDSSIKNTLFLYYNLIIILLILDPRRPIKDSGERILPLFLDVLELNETRLNEKESPHVIILCKGLDFYDNSLNLSLEQSLEFSAYYWFKIKSKFNPLLNADIIQEPLENYARTILIHHPNELFEHLFGNTPDNIETKIIDALYYLTKYYQFQKLKMPDLNAKIQNDFAHYFLETNNLTYLSTETRSKMLHICGEFYRKETQNTFIETLFKGLSHQKMDSNPFTPLWESAFMFQSVILSERDFFFLINTLLSEKIQVNKSHVSSLFANINQLADQPNALSLIQCKQKLKALLQSNKTPQYLKTMIIETAKELNFEY